jgi:hypothetical protein
VRLEQRLFVLVLLAAAGGVAASCSSENLPLAPPVSEFPVPADAPAEAAAPAGTTRVLITAIQFFGPDGRVEDPAALQGNVLTRFRTWIFCPRGLEGPFDYAIPTGSFYAGTYQLRAGYNDISNSIYISAKPTPQRFRFEVIRDLCLAVGSSFCGYGVVAFKEINLVIRP